MTVDVHAEARQFAQQIQDLIDAVLPLPAGVRSEDRQVDSLHLPTKSAKGRVRYSVQVGHGPKPGKVALLKNGMHVASLMFVFTCTHDRDQSYLAVDESHFELHEAGDRVPLLRLDFLKGAHKVPTAHWNVHAERGSMSRLLARANPEHVGLLSKVHIPVGGTRMRPCLEDLHQLCLVEFGIDRLPGAQEALDAGRERWRRLQAATLVRDAPDEAVRVLTGLVYRVEPPENGRPAHNDKALRGW